LAGPASLRSALPRFPALRPWHGLSNLCNLVATDDRVPLLSPICGTSARHLNRAGSVLALSLSQPAESIAMTKMDWDRVHREDLGKRRRAKYGPAKKRRLRLSTPKRKRKPPRSKKPPALRQMLSSGTAMPGCTCGKPVGFMGLHKTACPMRRRNAVNALAAHNPSRTNFVLSDFSGAVKASGYAVLLKRLLADCLKVLTEVPTINAAQREKSESAVRAMLEQLET